MSLYDFHIHSIYSDGNFSPKEIVELAKKRKMKGLALTDHDSINGVSEFIQLATEAGLVAIAGVEISTHHNGYRLDILGYGVDISNPKIINQLADLKNQRNARNSKQIAKLIELGFKIDAAKVAKEESNPGGLNTPRLVEIILSDKRNLDKISKPTLKGVFTEHLKLGRPAYVPINKFSSIGAIKLIHDCGGIASFAHPAESVENFEELEKIIRDLTKAGLDCIETYSPKHDMEHIHFIKGLAAELNLTTTFGSDFHGEDDMHADLGGLEIPDEGGIVERLLEKLKIKV